MTRFEFTNESGETLIIERRTGRDQFCVAMKQTNSEKGEIFEVLNRQETIRAAFTDAFSEMQTIQDALLKKCPSL